MGRGIRRLAAIAVVTVLVGIGLAAPASASATVLNPVVPGSIAISHLENGDGGLVLGSLARVDLELLFPEDAAAGDTFALTLPAAFSVAAGLTFDLTVTGSGAPIATCEVSPWSDTTPSTVTCELTDYFDGAGGRGEVAADMFLRVQTRLLTSSETVQVTIPGGAVYTVPLPGGVAVGYPGPPATTTKQVGQNPDGTFTWGISVATWDLPAGTTTVTIDDTLRPADGSRVEAHEYVDPFPLEVRMTTRDGSGPEVAAPASFSATAVVAPDRQSFSATVSGPFDPAYGYVVRYSTRPIGTPYVGAWYVNEATVAGLAVTATATYGASGGGSGAGEQMGRFSILKQVPADVTVPDGTRFGVEYRIGAGTTWYPLTLTAGGPTAFSAPVEAGTTLTVRETTAPTVPGVSSWVPEFSVDGTPLVADGTGAVTVTPGAGETIAVTLTNTPDLPVPTTPTAPTTTTTTAPTTSTGPTSGTGSTSSTEVVVSSTTESTPATAPTPVTPRTPTTVTTTTVTTTNTATAPFATPSATTSHHQPKAELAHTGSGVALGTSIAGLALLIAGGLMLLVRRGDNDHT